MSRYQQNSGKGRDLIIVALLLCIGVFVIKWYTQKPAPPKTIIVHEEAPAPVQPAPAPVVVTPPPAPAPAPAPVIEQPPKIVAIPVPPPTPESQILEGELHDAQTAADQAKADLDAAKTAAIQQFQNSPDYVTARADVETTKVAKDAAVQRVQNDMQNGSDTTEADQATLHAAEAAWLTANQKLNELQSQTTDADPTVTQKQQTLKTAVANVADLQGRLSACIQNNMTAVVKDDECPIQSVAYDAATTSIVAILSPAQSLSPGEAADRAFEEIGMVLEKVLHNAPFTWTTALFRVNGKYNGQKAIEFQVSYTRDGVDNTNFATIDHGASMDDQGLVNLATEFWLSPLINMMQDPNALQASVNSSGSIPYYASSSSSSVNSGGGITYYNDILIIGGYRRADGTYRNPLYIRKKHDNKNEAAPPPVSPGRIFSGGNTANQTSTPSATVAGAKQSSSQQQTQGQSKQQTKSTTPPPKPPPPPPPPPKQQQQSAAG
jgi:chemotaxis protein histidine kinase CheA